MRQMGDARLIPAHAGKTLLKRIVRKRRAAHPRSRGENGQVISIVITVSGSSPLTRGKRACMQPGIVR